MVLNTSHAVTKDFVVQDMADRHFPPEEFCIGHVTGREAHKLDAELMTTTNRFDISALVDMRCDLDTMTNIAAFRTEEQLRLASVLLLPCHVRSEIDAKEQSHLVLSGRNLQCVHRDGHVFRMERRRKGAIHVRFKADEIDPYEVMEMDELLECKPLLVRDGGKTHVACVLADDREFLQGGISNPTKRWGTVPTWAEAVASLDHKK